MKKLALIAMCLSLAISVTSCSQRDAAANNQSSASAVQKPDMNDLEALKQTYLVPIIFSGATMKSWTDPSVIEARNFVDMYGYTKVWNAGIPESDMVFENETPYYYVDEKTLESYVLNYFEISNDYIHTAEQYDSERKAYAFNMSGVGFAYDPQISKAEYDDANNELLLYLDDGHGGSKESGEVSIVTIRLYDNGTFKYISNKYNA